MNERVKFCVLADNENASITHLCKDFDISRKTGYKWLARYRLEGPRKMEERSRRARHYPNQTSEEVEQLIILERKKHKSWGPKKLQWSLAKNPEIENLPARSTIGEILRRNGLSQRRRRKPGLYHVERKELSVAQYPNHVWAVDFKGWFLTSDGERCDPLTTSDLYSRYLLYCKAQTIQQHTLYTAELSSVDATSRASRDHSSRQWNSLCFDGNRRSFQAKCVVDFTRHPGRVYSPWKASR